MLPGLNRFPSAANGQGVKPLADKLHAKDGSKAIGLFKPESGAAAMLDVFCLTHAVRLTAKMDFPVPLATPDCPCCSVWSIFSSIP